MTDCAPIAVFAYDRADTLATTLAALAACVGVAGRRVHIYCDAPARADRSAAVEQTRALARSWAAQHRARVILRPENMGFHNITAGISELCASEGAVISLEDDHVPAPSLLTFLDRGLAAYRSDERVFQVAGYRIGTLVGDLPETFFLPMPMPIGWATWDRAWSHFRWDVAEQVHVLDDPATRRAFDLDDTYPASRLLARTLAGSFQSYFIRWYLAMFLAGGLSLCARDSLVLNAGLASGVHGHAQVAAERQQFFNGAWAAQPRSPLEWTLPNQVAVDPAVYRHVCAELRARSAHA